MTLAFDASSSASSGGTSALTLAHTCTGTDLALVVMASCPNGYNYLAGSTATYNGVSMGAARVNVAGGSNEYSYLWVLANPASGTHNIVVTPTGSAYLDVIGASFTGVDQTTPVGSTANSQNGYAVSPYSTNITVASGGCAVDFFTKRSPSATLTVDGTQTQIAQTANSVSRSGASYKAAATAMSWTFSESQPLVTHLIVALQAAAAADTTAPTLTSPTGTQTGSTTASGTVSTDEGNGTLYYLASVNATETAATVKAAASQAVSGTGSQSVSFTGLTASTTYYAHYCHRDAAGNDSTVSNSASFTTAAAASTYAPRLFTPRSGMGSNFFGAR